MESQSPGPGTRAPGKSWFRRHKILTGLGAVVVVFFGSAAVTGIVQGIKHPIPANSATAAPQPEPVVAPAAPPSAHLAPGALAAPGPESAASLASPATRGLLDPVAYWDRTHQSAPISECSAQGENAVGIGKMHAWRTGGGGLVCYDEEVPGGGPPWGGRIVGLDIYFARHTDERQASEVAAAVLPADARELAAIDGVNADYSHIPTGSCRQLVYYSQTLAAAVKAADPSWTGDPAKATITLYSGHANGENGSDAWYAARSINEVIIVIGGENRGADGFVHC